jgi:hypothetical protein
MSPRSAPAQKPLVLPEVRTAPLMVSSVLMRSTHSGPDLLHDLTGQGVHRTARHVEGDQGDAVGVDVDLEVFHARDPQTRSMTVAVPMPPPMHRVIRAVSLFGAFQLVQHRCR